MVFGRVLRRERRKKSVRMRAGFAFWWLIVVAYAYMIPTFPNFNTESHLYTAFAIVDHSTVAIDAYQQRLGDRAVYRGHTYSDKAPGVALLEVPFYAVLERVAPGLKGKGYGVAGRYQYSIARDTAYIRYAITYFLLIVPSALFSILLWLFLARFLASGWAMALAGVYALGTIAFPYSVWLFSHQITAILLFCAFLLIFTRVKERSISRSVLLSAALAGLAAGYSVISEYPTALIAAALAAYLLSVTQNRFRTGAAFLLGMVPPAVAGATYNMAAFGKPFATGYAYVRSSMYVSTTRTGLFGLANPTAYGVRLPSWDSLYGITVSPYRGLFLYSPVLLLVVPGLVVMARRRQLRAEWILTVALLVGYIVFVAARPEDKNGWAGGWSVSSRHLTPIVPFMLLPIALALSRRAVRILFVVLGAASVALMSLIMVTDNSGGFPLGDRNPLVNVLLPDLRAGKIDVNWGWLLGLRGWASLIPYLVVAGLLLWRVVWLLRRDPDSRAVQPEGEGAARPVLEPA